MTAQNTDVTQIERPHALPLEVWPYQIRTVRIGDNAIAYTDEGEGPVLVLVHDGMWSYIWGQLIEKLSHHFRVLTFDFPGSGLSPADGGPASLEADSMLLDAFVEHIGITDFTFVLHDLGGVVGLGSAMRHPEAVNGLVLMNTFGWPPHVASLRTMFALMDSRPVRALNVATNAIPKLSSGGSGIGRLLDDSARSAFLAGFATKGQRRRFHNMIGAARRETKYLADVESSLSGVLAEKPALTIYGEKNDPFGFQAKFAEYFPGAWEKVIPGGNHFPMADDPVGVADLIRTWHREVVR